jgi:hypothetical protein
MTLAKKLSAPPNPQQFFFSRRHSPRNPRLQPIA